MKRYLLSIYQPDGDPPPADVLTEIARDVRAVEEELRSAGAWVFSGGLHAPSTATVVLPRQEEMPMTDGPYVEGKEHIGGLTIIKAATLDEALQWGPKARPRHDAPDRGAPVPGRARRLTAAAVSPMGEGRRTRPVPDRPVIRGIPRSRLRNQGLVT